MNGKNGFTLIEVIIVVIVIGILATVSVPIYRRYVKEQMSQEGIALLQAIAAAQNLYHEEHNTFYPGCGFSTEYDTVLDVDTRENQYFKEYIISGGGVNSWTGSVAGVNEAEGITVSMTGHWDAPPEITVSGLSD